MTDIFPAESTHSTKSLKLYKYISLLFLSSTGWWKLSAYLKNIYDPFRST